MKIKAKARALAGLMKTVTRAAATRSTTPVLGCVLFEAKAGVLTVSATDMDISIRISCAAPIEEEGTAAIGARLLSDVVRSLPPDTELSLETGEQGATLSSAGGVYTMRVYPARDFPKISAFPEGSGVFSIPVATLAEGVEKVAVAATDDETRPVLTGLSTSFGAGKLCLAATDSYRLALYETPVENGPAEERAAIIPAKALREVVRLSAAGTVEDVEVALTENAAHFRAGPTELTTRLIAGNFPDYNSLLPAGFAHTYTVDASAMSKTLSRVNLFATKQTPPVPVKLAFTKTGSLEGGQVAVGAKSAEVGEASERLGAAVEEEFAAAFNGSYLADGIKICNSGKGSGNGSRNDSSGTIVFKFNGPMEPAIISSGTPAAAATDGKAPEKAPHKTPDDTSQADVASGPEKETKFLYLVMPMRDPEART